MAMRIEAAMFATRSAPFQDVRKAPAPMMALPTAAANAAEPVTATGAEVVAAPVVPEAAVTARAARFDVRGHPPHVVAVARQVLPERVPDVEVPRVVRGRRALEAAQRERGRPVEVVVRVAVAAVAAAEPVEQRAGRRPSLAVGEFAARGAAREPVVDRVVPVPAVGVVVPVAGERCPRLRTERVRPFHRWRTCGWTAGRSSGPGGAVVRACVDRLLRAPL